MFALFKWLFTFPLQLLRGTFQSVFVLLFILSTLIFIGSFFGDGIGATAQQSGQWAAVLDAMSQLRLQCLWIQSLCFVFFILLQDKAWVIASALVVVFNLSDIVPYFIPKPAPFSAQAGSLKVLQWNVHLGNRQPAEFIAYVQQMHPDVIAMEEVDQQWLNLLNQPLASYRYRVLAPQNNPFGVALYSRLPLHSQDIIYLAAPKIKEEPIPDNLPLQSKLLAQGQRGVENIWQAVFPPDTYPTIQASIFYRNQSITFFVFHPDSLFSGFEKRNQQYSELAAALSPIQDPVVVFGDFNASPWSVHFKRFIKDSGLNDTQYGHGLQTTWPNWNQLASAFNLEQQMAPLKTPLNLLAQLPRDYILASPNLLVLKRQIGPATTHSDHLPIYAELALEK